MHCFIFSLQCDPRVIMNVVTPKELQIQPWSDKHAWNECCGTELDSYYGLMGTSKSWNLALRCHSTPTAARTICVAGKPLVQYEAQLLWRQDAFRRQTGARTVLVAREPDVECEVQLPMRRCLSTLSPGASTATPGASQRAHLPQF